MLSGTMLWGWGFMKDLIFDYAKSWGNRLLDHWYWFAGIILWYILLLFLYKVLWDFILKH